MDPPMAVDGKLVLNFAFKAPEEPWDLTIFPQTTFLPWYDFGPCLLPPFAIVKYATLFPK